MKKDLLGVYLQHDKRYISKLWSIMTNASGLYNLLLVKICEYKSKLENYRKLPIIPIGISIKIHENR